MGPDYRYILSCNVIDQSGSIWATAFEESAKIIMGGTEAKELNHFKENDMTDQYISKFISAQWKFWDITLKVKEELGNDGDTRMKHTIVTARPMDFKATAYEMLDELQKMQAGVAGF